MARTKQTARYITHNYTHNHVCGLYFILPGRPVTERLYLPQLSLAVNANIISSTSRTTLTQTFVNPRSDPIPELRYTFPLYDGVSVVGFVCTINGDRVIRGVVKERAEAKETYKAAVDRGETAGLLEQLPEASDVFTTTIGNVPANATLKVDITYLGELKHDAELDGIRFTIPTRIAPRYGSYPGQLLETSAVDTKAGISIVVDVEMPNGSNVKNVQSPSHPISVTLGNTSVGAASGADMSLQKASATLALSTAELGDDFVLQVVATNTGNPIAVLETHPTLANHRALMTTLVPKFNLPSSRPEIVFLCDRSGSMSGKIPGLKTALHLFLKSLPVGVKFNICSFGSHHHFLFPDGSRTYDASTLEEATRYVDLFDSNFGGTDIYRPMADVFKKRYTDMDLEVFLLTDGEIWDQAALFELLNKQIAESEGRIRVFSLGIGSDVSHALIEGVAAAGNGFSQCVGDNESMNSKVVRMLKASLTPHVKDYTLEVKYAKEVDSDSDSDFELVEKVMDALAIDVKDPETKAEAPKKTISLFDPSVDPDVEMTDASTDNSAGGKYSHLPPVSEPKFLQAPFKIPPLYPFSRTTVYLLLSPETAQKQPKSVVLRGTTPYGPVELEIPVTVLADKGETIHQLAARKAVKELEEGRGWIYHAKDAKDAGGALLKDKYPGRFQDMVEREAVRLGVTFQIGGKWCSFVAVEANEGTPDKPEQQKEKEKSARYSSYTPSSVIAPPPPPPGGPSFQMMALASAPCPAPPPALQGAPAPSPKMARGGGGFGSFGFGSASRSRDRDSSSSRSSSGLFSLGGRKEKREEQGLGESLKKKSARAPTPSPPRMLEFSAEAHSEEVEESDDDCGYALFDSDSPPRPPLPASAMQFLAKTESEGGRARGRQQQQQQQQDYANLAATRSWIGSWKWEEQLLVLLGLAKKEGGFEPPAGLGGKTDRAATALVLVFLAERGAEGGWKRTILSFPGISLTGSAHVSAAVWDPYNSDPRPGAGASRRDWVSVLANSAQPWLLDDLGGDVSGERELIKWDVGKQAVAWRVGLESVTKGRYGGFQDVEHDRWGRTYIMGTYPGTILRVDRDGSGLTEWSVPEPLPPTRQKGWSGVAVVRETGGETMLAVDGDGRIYRFDLREEKGTAVHVPMWPEVLYNDTDAIYLPPMYGGKVLLVASVYTGIQVLRSEDRQWTTADYLGTIPIPSGELYEGAFWVSSVQMGSSSVFMVLFYSSDVQPGALAGNKTEFPFRDITDDINALLWNESRRGRS
ncbi:hypothetical protein NEMBOFW57_002038 [Staphylotrichum longicolle]|uniref:Uncharacterized protein n=1 Tax=Staphylotrichum longicolle TaxID=669026 RepID=A0AAD4I1E2_9PEZI|nr:hypothetical protein NEMBOFW57_002038 [Staphylotrichum longicolle]